MTVALVDLLATFLVGLIGSSAVLFATYVGLSKFESLPAKIFTSAHIAIYIFLGGAIATVVQLGSDTWAPVQALAIGAGWPAIVAGIITPAAAADQAKSAVNNQVNEINNFLSNLPD
jgi:hypothetical protein